MRASRLVSVLLLLQNRGRLTAAQLAAELEVSERTVYRDIGALLVSGVPIRAITGPEGGYQLLDGYRTRLTGLTAAEAESLFVAGIPYAAAGLGLVGTLSGAQLKLLAALPQQARDRATRFSERFYFDAPNWYSEPDETRFLGAVTDATWSQHRLRVRYRRWEAPQEVERVIEPFGVVLKAGVWYVVARVADSLRTFRISRILELDTLDEEFTRPADFDLSAHWTEYLAELSVRLRDQAAVVRLSPAAVALLPDLWPPEVVRAVADTGTAADAEGWVTARIPIENPEHAVRELLPLGAEFEVLEPAELRQRIAAATAALAARHAATTAGCPPPGTSAPR